ncbi:LPXTG cell wall anchor domain-containing protein [Enterococcus casseliflavus]|nr:LPXTG cell wall anchor domain-containing protein [Enterococcus casseliflavus]
MKGINYKKLMDSKKNTRVRTKKNIIANLTVSGMLLTSTVVVPASLLWAPTTVEAALVSAELFSDITASNNSGTSASAPYATPGATNQVNFSISGSNAVTVDVLNGDKVAVVGVPQGLTGLVQPAGNASISTNVTLQLGNFPALQTLIGTVTPAVNTLISTVDGIVNQNLADALDIPPTIGDILPVPNPLYTAASIVDVSQVISVNLAEITTQLDLLNQLGQFGQANFDVPAGLTENERALIANVDDGLFIVVNQRINQILDNLQAAQIQVSILDGASSIPGIGTLISGINTLVQTTVNTAKATLNGTVETAQNVLNATTDLADQVASASVLGQTNVVIPTNVTSPTYAQLVENGVANPSTPYEARFEATMSQLDLITIDLFTDADGNNSIWFAPDTPEDQTDTPTINPLTAGETTISGTAEPGAAITLAINGGAPITTTADGDGNWTTDVPELVEGDTVTAVAEADGESASEPATATVAAPVVNAPTASITGNSTDGYPVTGTAAANAAIEITNAEGEVVGTGTANENGNYSITLNPADVAENENLNVAAIVTAGGQTYRSGNTPIVVPADDAEQQTGTPTIQPVTAGDTSVSGTAEPGASITVTVNGADPIVTEADEEGNWRVDVDEVSEGDTVSAVAELEGQTPSQPASTTVSALTVNAPTASITGNSQEGYPVTGTAAPNAAIEITNADGEIVGTGTANENGVYTVTLDPADVAAEETLNVTAVVTAGGETYRSNPTPVVVPADILQTETPTIDPVSAGDTTVSGTAEPGATVTITLPEGDPITAEADDEGNWEATVPELSEGDSVTVVAESEGKDPSAPITVSVSGLTVAAPTATITGNSTDGYPVTGTATANAAIEILNEAGDVVGSGTADDDGNFTITLDPQEVAAGDNLRVEAIVTAGGEDYRSTGTPLVVPADDVENLTETPTIDPVTAGDTTVSGTAEPGATVTITLPEGDPITAEADDEGNWEATVPELSEGDTVTVVAEAEGKDPSAPITVTVDGVTVSAPSASITGNSTDGYPVSGTTTPNAAIEILNEAGDVVGSTTADDTGAYTVTLDPADVAPAEALQVVAVVTAGGQDYRSNATPITVPADIEQTGTPTIDPVTAGDTTISGTAEPGSTVTVTITDQEPVTAETDDEGNWLAEVPAVSGGDTVTVVAEAEGKEPSAPISVGVAGVTVAAPTAISGNSTDGYPVTGTATPNAAIEILNAADEVVGSGEANEEGAYSITLSSSDVDPSEPLQVVAVVTAGGDEYRSAPLSIVVPADQTTAPTIDPVQAGDTSVGGTAEPGSTVTVEISGEDPVTAETDEEGNWTVTVPELSEGDTVTVVAEAEGKDPSEPISVGVGALNVAAPTATITGNSTDGYPVTGTAPANAAIEILNDADEVVGSGTANGDGEYTITLTDGVSPAETLRVVAMLTAGGQEYRSPATTIVVPEDNAEDQTAAPTVAPVVAGDTTVSGTAEPGAEVTVELPSGNTYTATANDEGEWTATVPTVSLDDVLTVTALADGKTESLPVTVTVQGLIVAAPTATISGNSSDGYPVTGTAPANAAIEILNADDQVIGTGTANENGVYTVTLTSEEVSAGETVRVVAIVSAGGDDFRSQPTSVVVPADQTATPTINPAVAGATEISGTAEPGATVSVTVGEQDPITAEVDDEGNWQAEVPALAEGTTVTAVAEIENETPSTPATITVGALTVAAPSASISGNAADGYPVTGTGPANATIEILNEAGEIVETGTTDDAGLYTINLTSEDVSPEENLTVVAVVTAGGKDYRSPATPIMVPAEPGENQTTAPTVDPIKAGDETVSGTAEPGSTVTVTLPDGTEETAETDDEGNWSVDVPELSEGDTITVVADSDGKDPSDPITVIVEGVTVAAPTASISGNSTDGYPLTGTAPANAAIEILNAANEVVGTGTADGDGNYTVALTAETVDPEETLNVVAIVTAGGKEYRSNPTAVIVPADTVVDQTAAPTIDPITAGDTSISGTAEPGSTVTITVPDAEPITAETDDEGNWTAEVPEVSEGDAVTVVAQSPDKEPSAPVTVGVGALTVTAPSATITGNSTDGYPVTGTAPANATVQILNSDGQIVGSGTADAEGNYSITLEPTAVAPAESLTVVAVLTAGGKEYRSNATPIVVPLDQEEQQTATPTIDPVKAGDTTISGTAEPGSTVTVTIGENEPITTETDEEGNWTVEVPEVAEGDTVTVVAQSPEKDPSAPITVSVDGITVSAPTASITGNPEDGYPVTGMAAPNAAIEILNEAGEVVGSGTTDENGNYTITLSGEAVSPEESLNVVAIITAGGKDYRSNATPIVVPVENTIDQTATPIIEPVTAGDTTITGTAVAGAMVTVTVTGEEAVETEADEAGNWSVDVAEVSRDEIVTAVAQSEGETASEPATTVVNGITVNAPSASITGNSQEGYPVTGNGPANAAIDILNEAGDVVGTGTTDENGDYTITLTSEDVAPEENLSVVAIVTAGGDDYRSNATPIVVPVDDESIKTDTPTIDPVTAGDTTISGTSEPGATITLTISDPLTSRFLTIFAAEGPITTIADQNGDWRVELSAEATEGETVTVLALADGETLSDPTTTVVDALTVDAPVATITGNPTDGYPVFGNGPANATIEILNEAGDVVGTGTTNGNGAFSITLDPEDVSPEETLNVVAIVTAGGREYRSAATPIVVPTGDNGTDGSDGTDGTDGSDGTDGTNGSDGTNGTDGSNGAWGNWGNWGNNNWNSNNNNQSWWGSKFLPKTGSEGTWYASVIGAAVFVVGGIGLFFKARKKKDQQK